MTLIEMLVFIAVFSMVTAMLYEAIAFLYRTHGHQFASSLALSDATRQVQTITRQVRSSVYGDDGSYPLTTIASSTLIFFADVDGDIGIERVQYRLTNTTLERGIIEPTATSSYPIGNEVWTTVVTGVNNSARGIPLFRYYDSEAVEVTLGSDILDVRGVVIELVVTSSAGRQIGDTTLRSGASIRNLRDAY